MTLNRHARVTIGAAVATVLIASSASAPVNATEIPSPTSTATSKKVSCLRISAQADNGVQSALKSYASESEKVYLASPAKLRAMSASEQSPAEEAQLPIAEAERAAGDKVTDVTISQEVVASKALGAGKYSVVVYKTTELTLDVPEGYPSDSSWSDYKEVTFEMQGTKLVAVDEEYVDPPANCALDDSVETPEPEGEDEGLDDEKPRESSGDPNQDDDSWKHPVAEAQRAATKGYPLQNKISPTKFSAYATKWTSGKHAGDSKKYFNSAYPYYKNNCANFASQVLRAGGWYRTSGHSLQVKDKHVWTSNLAGVAGASRTWTSAKDLYTFANNTGSYKWLSNIYKAKKGDLLFVDWDPKGKRDGKIDHVMVVSAVNEGGIPLISQKSSNRKNLNLMSSAAIAKEQGRKKIAWYGLKHL